MECRDIRFWNHSGLMPANLITLPHFSVSSAISLPNSAGEPGSTVAPKSAKRALIMGSARPAFTSLLSTSMIAAGVLRRAETEPCARLVARHEIAHDRNFGQHVGARRGGHRERTQSAGFDVRRG